MKTYRVTWSTDVDANDIEGAAHKARYCQTRPGTTAVVFTVFESVDTGNNETGYHNPVSVDLLDDEPRKDIDISGELFDFAQQIARMTTAEEMDDASEIYGEDEECMSGDDACAAISNLIEAARELVAKVEPL